MYRKKVIVSDTGYPFTTKTIDYLGDWPVKALDSLANFFGPLMIVSGCQVSGTKVTDGLISYNGKLIPFVESTFTDLSTDVIGVSNEQDNDVYDTQGGLTPLPSYERTYCGFGVPANAGSFKFTDLTRIPNQYQQLSRFDNLPNFSLQQRKPEGLLSLVCSGRVDASGARLDYYGPNNVNGYPFDVTRVGRGHYRITHNQSNPLLKALATPIKATNALNINIDVIRVGVDPNHIDIVFQSQTTYLDNEFEFLIFE